MYFWKYILAKKAGLSQQKCNMALYGLPVLPIAEAFEKTVTGNPISVSDALAQDALSLQVSFTPTQDGTPSIDSEPTNEPYLSKVIPRGNKEYYSLVGGTVAWNQLVENGDFASTSGWSTYNGATFSVSDNVGIIVGNGNAGGSLIFTDVPRTANHRYYMSVSMKTDGTVSGRIKLNNMGYPVGPSVTGTNWERITLILPGGTGSQANGRYQFVVEEGKAGTIYVKDFVVIDLTQMFGSTIADYIYTLEQTEAGSGIAWLKSYGFFTEDYYAYNPGELISVNTSGHKVGNTTYPIDPTDLRGLFKLSNGKLYCEGDTYPPSGSVVRKYSIVDLGTLAWRMYNSGKFFVGTLVKPSTTNAIMTANYKLVTTASLSSLNNLEYSFDNSGYLQIRNDAYTSGSGFKTAMSGTYLVAELATPTTETATPYTSPATVEAGGTEEFVDNRTIPIPVGNETYYASEYAVHGKTGVTVSHGATEDDPNPTEYEVEFTSQGTVYGGTVDIVTGVLTVTWGYIASYNGETLTGEWMSSKDVYAEGITPSTGAEVAYELATPQTYNLTPEQVTMLLGDNYLETEDGTITITYMAGK